MLQIDAKELHLADDFKDEKRREKKGDGLHQEAMMIGFFCSSLDRIPRG